MDVFTANFWTQITATVVALLGVAIFWRGVHGGPDGERGLLRRHVAMLERVHGWRMTVLGLTMIGAGAAWFWDARWLLILSLGVGFVEFQEATRIIRSWHGTRGA
jgi:hypothetical protein